MEVTLVLVVEEADPPTPPTPPTATTQAELDALRQRSPRKADLWVRTARIGAHLPRVGEVFVVGVEFLNDSGRVVDVMWGPRLSTVALLLVGDDRWRRGDEYDIAPKSNRLGWQWLARVNRADPSLYWSSYLKER